MTLEVLQCLRGVILWPSVPLPPIWYLDAFGDRAPTVLNAPTSSATPPGQESRLLLVIVQSSTESPQEEQQLFPGATPTGLADVVFVDGDHSFEGTLMDLQIWWHRLKPGGFLFGCDRHNIFPGVAMAVAIFCAQQKCDRMNVVRARSY